MQVGTIKSRGGIDFAIRLGQRTGKADVQSNDGNGWVWHCGLPDCTLVGKLWSCTASQSWHWALGLVAKYPERYRIVSEFV